MNSEDRLLLGGGIALTMDDELGDCKRGDVLIEDGKIIEVRQDLQVAADAARIARDREQPGVVGQAARAGEIREGRGSFVPRRGRLADEVLESEVEFSFAGFASRALSLEF